MSSPFDEADAAAAATATRDPGTGSGTRLIRALTPGLLLGNCRLEQQIGEGAVGAVWRARHEGLGIPVAVKVLKGRGASADPLYRERFRREAQTAARLDHPGIVRVLDCGEQDGIPFMVMEFIDGYTLESYLRRMQGQVPETTILRLIQAAASALAAAHAAGIVHRDLKPANLLITRKGMLKIADLGLARSDEVGARLTQERITVGTPAYMAPECFQPDIRTDHRIDLYALGVIAYQLVFGRLPYDGTITQVVQGHLGGQARFDAATSRGKRLIALVRKLMAPDREQRPREAALVAAEARAILDGSGLRPATRAANAATGSAGSSSAAAAAAAGSDFTSIARFLEGRLGAHTSQVEGRTIVHTTGRERRLVWLVLAVVVGVAVAGFVLTRH